MGYRCTLNNIMFVKNRLEQNLTKLKRQPNVSQDFINLRSFLNCVTHNFSIKRSFIDKSGLFNTLYNYSSSDDSGYGWEDVEFGYRCYLRGARIFFASNTFALHCDHPPLRSSSDSGPRSVENFRKLIEHNPELVLVARRWVRETYQKLKHWISVSRLHSIDESRLKSLNDNLNYLDSKILPYRNANLFIKIKRPLRILTYRWHCAHQYELYKSGHSFTLVTGIGSTMCDNWSYSIRPLPHNASLVNINAINPKEYDLAILHFDEHSFNTHAIDRMAKGNTRWGDAFKYFMTHIDIPKVAICHGTPQFDCQYTTKPIDDADIVILEAVSYTHLTLPTIYSV